MAELKENLVAVQVGVKLWLVTSQELAEIVHHVREEEKQKGEQYFSPRFAQRLIEEMGQRDMEFMPEKALENAEADVVARDDSAASA